MTFWFKCIYITWRSWILVSWYSHENNQQDTLFFLWCCDPTRVMAASILGFSLDHTQRRTTVGRTHLNKRSARRKDLYLTTQHSKQTNIHAPGGILTHDLSRRAAADLRLRSRGHWDRQQDALYRLIDYSKSGLHVSGDDFTHHQEHLTVFTVSGSVHPSCCRLAAGSNLGERYQVNTVKCSWWWAKTSPETRRADLE
jgi:hypothetical protein